MTAVTAEETIKQLTKEVETWKSKSQTLEESVTLERDLREEALKKLEEVKELSSRANKEITTKTQEIRYLTDTNKELRESKTELTKQVKELTKIQFANLRISIYKEPASLINDVKFNQEMEENCKMLKNYTKSRLMEIIVNMSRPQFITTIDKVSCELKKLELSGTFEEITYELDYSGKEIKYGDILKSLDGISSIIPAYPEYQTREKEEDRESDDGIEKEEVYMKGTHGTQEEIHMIKDETQIKLVCSEKPGKLPREDEIRSAWRTGYL